MCVVGWGVLNHHIYLEMKIGNVSNMDLGVYSCGKVGVVGGGGGGG